MDEENNARKKRRRSMRTLRRRSEILPVNLLSVEEGVDQTLVEGKLLGGNDETFGSLWYESQEPVKERRKRRSNIFAALPLQIPSEIEEEPKLVMNEVTDCTESSEGCSTNSELPHVPVDQSNGQVADQCVMNENKSEENDLSMSAGMAKPVQSSSDVGMNYNVNNNGETSQNNSLNAGFLEFNTPSCESSPLAEETSKISPSSMSPDFPMSPTKLIYSPGTHEESYIRKSITCETSTDNVDLNACLVKDDSFNCSNNTSKIGLTVEFDNKEAHTYDTNCTNTSAINDKDLSSKDSPGFFSVCKTVAGKVFDFVKTSPSYLTGAVFSANNSADLSSSPVLKISDSRPIHAENVDNSKQPDTDNDLKNMVIEKCELETNDYVNDETCCEAQVPDISGKSMVSSFIEQLPDISSKPLSVSLTASARKQRDWTAFNDTLNAISKIYEEGSSGVTASVKKNSHNVAEMTEKSKSGKELFKSKTEIKVHKQSEAQHEEYRTDTPDKVIENESDNIPDVQNDETVDKSELSAINCHDVKKQVSMNEVASDMNDYSLVENSDVLSPLVYNMDNSYGNKSLRLSDIDKHPIESVSNSIDVNVEQRDSDSMKDDFDGIDESKTAGNDNIKKLMVVESEEVKADLFEDDTMKSSAPVGGKAELCEEKIVDSNKSSTDEIASSISADTVTEKEYAVPDKKKARRRAFGFLTDKKEGRVKKDKKASLDVKTHVKGTSETVEKVTLDKDSKLKVNDNAKDAKLKENDNVKDAKLKKNDNVKDVGLLNDNVKDAKLKVNDYVKVAKVKVSDYVNDGKAKETKSIDSCKETNEKYDTIEAMKEYNETINKINKIKRKYTRRSGKFNLAQLKNISESKTSYRVDLASVSGKKIESEVVDKPEEEHAAVDILVNSDDFVAIKNKVNDESCVAKNDDSEAVPKRTDDLEILSKNDKSHFVEINNMQTEKVKDSDIKNEKLNIKVNPESIVPKKRGGRKSADASTLNVQKFEIGQMSVDDQTEVENLQPKKRGREKSNTSAIALNVDSFDKISDVRVNDDNDIDNQSVVKKKRGRRKSADAATLKVSNNLMETVNDSISSEGDAKTVVAPIPKKRGRRKSADTATLKLTMLMNDNQNSNENGAKCESLSKNTDTDTENIAPIPKKRGRRKSADAATLKLTMLMENEGDIISPELGSKNNVVEKRGRRKSADVASLKLTMLGNEDSDESFNNENNSKRGRKRKIAETDEDVEKLYLNKNYVKPDENKAWQTIVESPAKSAEVYKKYRLQRFIDFEKPTQMKLRKRCQKAMKNGWDWQKWADSELDDDFVKSKLANLWQELDGETQTDELRSKLQSIVDTE